MFEFDDIESSEQARHEEEEEERQRSEQAAYLAKVLEIEAVVEARLQPQEDEQYDGVLGVLITIPVKDFEYLKKWKDTTRVFFCDAMNASMTKLHKLLADGERNEKMGTAALDGIVDIIFAFLNVVMQLRFQEEAGAICEKLAEAFQGERGFCILVHHLMDAAASERRRRDAWKNSSLMLKGLVSWLLKLLMLAHWRSPEHREAFANVWVNVHAAARALCDEKQPFLLSMWLEHGWQVPPDQAMQVTLQLEDPPEERSMYVSGQWTVAEIQASLWHYLQCEAELLQPREGTGELEAADPALRFEEVRQPLVLRGLDHAHPGWQKIEFPTWPPEWATNWRFLIKKVCKTTPLTATRMLSELRGSFTSDEFQRQYRMLKPDSRPGNKAHQDILSLTFDVQSKVLPRYGYEATPKGLMEMRDEMMIYAGLDVWNFNPWGLDSGGDLAVWKVRRDIHSVLDMGQTLPRMQLSGTETLGHKMWLRWAQLNASVESSCVKAAELISQADVFVLSAGAGFSADSGLAVYADVAKVQAYAKRGLDYSEICHQRWLRAEPEFFWGFWGQCYNDYRDTAPHEGYGIVHGWVECRFRHSRTAHAIRRRLQESSQSEAAKSLAATMPAAERQPYLVEDHAGAFMAFTSNVDAHLWDWFRASEIRECHGNTETYQCASLETRCDGHWRAPFNYRFRINKSTMLAPAGKAEQARLDDVASEALSGDGATPHVGYVRGGGRPDALRHMPAPPSRAAEGFDTNHPRCPFCNAPARPSILMFKDTDYKDNRPQAARWDAWVAAAKDVIQSTTQEGVQADTSGRAPRVVILEIGAGGNVTTVRKSSEKLIHDFTHSGAEAHLVRINPELPLGDSERLGPGGDLEHLVVSIMGCALESIRRIDAAMPPAMRGEGS